MNKNKILFVLMVFLAACAPVRGIPSPTPIPSKTPSPTNTSTPIPSTSIPPSPTMTYTAEPTSLPTAIENGVWPRRLVPAGKFTMGSNIGLENEQPAHEVFVDNFYIDQAETPNYSYQECVEAGSCLTPKDLKYFSDYDFTMSPVVFVDWNMAKTYCEWRGGRLPTEAEWEKAARSADERSYPWGEEINCRYANYKYYHSDPFYLYCVDRFPLVFYSLSGASPYEIYDMAGNVSEWVSSLFAPYPYSKTDGRENVTAPGDRVVRGGSWASASNELYTYHRFVMSPGSASDRIGIRCAFDP